VTGRINFDPETGNPRAWLNKDDKPTTALEVTADRVTLHTWPDQIGEDTDEDDSARRDELEDTRLDDIPF
jgi:hypothetical protein